MIAKNSIKQCYLRKHFYSHLNMEVIADAYSAHAKIVCKGFEIKKIGDCHDLYVQSDTLLLADVFENFITMCINIYRLDPAKFFFSSKISMASRSKKYQSTIRSFNRCWYVINGRKRY